MSSSPQDSSEATSFGLKDIRALLLTQQQAMLFTFGAVVLLVSAYTLLSTPLYQGRATLHLTIPTTQESGEKSLTASSVAPWGAGRDIYFETQLQVMSAPELQRRTLEAYESLRSRPDPYLPSLATLKKATKIELRPGTELVDISVLHPDAESAAILANTIAKTYQEHNLNAGRESAAEARAWLEEQLLAYAERINELQNALVDYQVEHDIADANQATTTLAVRIEAIKERLAIARADLIMLGSQIDNHQQMLNAGAFDDLAKQINTPLLASLTTNYADAVTDLVRLSARYGPRHPERVAAESVLDRITDELRREIKQSIQADQAQRQVLEDRVRSLEHEIAEVNEIMLEKQRVRDGFARLQAEIQRGEAQQSRLAERKDILDLLSRTQLNNARLITPAAVPTAVAQPKWLTNLAVGGGLGVVLAFGVGLVRSQLDETIQGPLDITGYLGASYLGTISEFPGTPESAEQAALYTHEHPHSVLAESIRAIRTVLDNTHVDRPLQRILVTSSLQGEGKTDTSIRFATAFARSGRRVLLIDADLRRPRLHKACALAHRRPGLGDVLLGLPVEDAIQTTPIPGVDLLPAGQGGSQVTELLGTSHLSGLLDSLESEYDMLILDSSPVLPTADPGLLSKFVDGVLLLARAGKVHRRALQHAYTSLVKINAPMLGVVINGATAASEAAGGYYGGRYSYYRYGAGYGQDATEEDGSSAAK